MSYPAGESPFMVAMADLNADTKPDLVVVNHGDNNVSVLIGNGNGTFQPRVNYGAGSNPRAVAIGELSGDARFDLVVANFGSDTVSVLLGVP